MKTITLKQTGYYVTGLADITLWGNDQACIEMKPFVIPKVTKKLLLENINDNGFGVQSINGAICNVWDLYQDGYKKFVKTIKVGKISKTTESYYDRHFPTSRP